MIIRLSDIEFGEVDYFVVNKNDERIEEKADFFFDNDFDRGKEPEILEEYNEEFEETLTLEQAKKALRATDYGGYGQTIDRYFDVFEALGYEPLGIVPDVDLEIVIEP